MEDDDHIDPEPDDDYADALDVFDDDDDDWDDALDDDDLCPECGGTGSMDDPVAPDGEIACTECGGSGEAC